MTAIHQCFQMLLHMFESGQVFKILVMRPGRSFFSIWFFFVFFSSFRHDNNSLKFLDDIALCLREAC